ncbi:MAG TPA: hypothetical protein PLF40_21580 [Kofleriaceae bacterium]|nr:hypothetical protein [Kofleriaceae bacterium]
MKRSACCSLLVGVVGTACTAPPNQRQFLVDETRLIAVTATPAEAAPGTAVMLQAYFAAPQGTPLDQQTTWSVCLAPKAPSEDNAVAPACLDASTTVIGPGSAQHTVTATMPADACARFGPDTPPGDFRPRAADATGGYYQPFRVDATPLARTAIGMARIVCNLPSAPPAVAQAYRTQYRANMAPQVTLTTPARVPRDSEVDFTASWPATDAEPYLWFEATTDGLTQRRESMRVNWFVTAGELPFDASLVDESNPATSVTITWHAPAEPGRVTLWAVVRDSRGGMAVQQTDVVVE